MKKIELPKEAIYREVGAGKIVSEKLWFYEEFEKGGNYAHWKMSLYELDPVIKPIEKIDGVEINRNYQEYKMMFNDNQGWKIEFRFRKYEDSDFYMIYKDGENITELVEDYDDLAGCCRSAMYFMCTRV